MCCLFRFCCEPNDDSDDEENLTGRNSSRHAVGPARMTRRVTPVDSIEYHRYQREREQPVEDRGDEEVCCHDNNLNPRIPAIHEFLRKLQESWRKYESLETETLSTENEDNGIEPGHFQKKDALDNHNPTSSHPLKVAQEFDSERGIPTIHPDEVVIPGSPLQREMAMSMKLEAQGDECVICMESFEASNPRMPTLCGCGQNKTFFHLPCLYQWIEQSRNCPSCRKRLRWEEF